MCLKQRLVSVMGHGALSTRVDLIGCPNDHPPLPRYDNDEFPFDVRKTMNAWQMLEVKT